MTNAFINSHVVTMAVVRRIILMAYPECTPEALPGEFLLLNSVNLKRLYTTLTAKELLLLNTVRIPYDRSVVWI
jgi:hypothetical protein